MSKPRQVKSAVKKSVIETVLEYSRKKNVYIIFDALDESEEAKMDTPYSYDKSNNVLTIVVSKFSGDDKQKLLDLVKSAFNKGEVILKRSNAKILDSYSRYSKKNEDKVIIDFFQGSIPADDLDALKASLYIRSEVKKGHAIHGLKNDIREKYGERGANIANLCSANYFENELIPLLNNATREEFEEYYELAVGKKARALFVHSGMGINEIRNEFNSMIEKGLKYHMSDFRIHGMGITNVANLKTFFSEREKGENERFLVKKDFEKMTPAIILYSVILIY